MRTIIIALALLTGCATARPAARVAVESGRVKDSIPEKRAAQRANDPHQRAEDEERRWGIEESKQREEEQRRRAAQRAASRPGVDVTRKKDEGTRK